MKNFLTALIKRIEGKNAGIVVAALFFVLSLIWAIFGIFKTLVILLITTLGYYVGHRFLTNIEDFRDLLDKIFPPGRFR